MVAGVRGGRRLGELRVGLGGALRRVRQNDQGARGYL